MFSLLLPFGTVLVRRERRAAERRGEWSTGFAALVQFGWGARAAGWAGAGSRCLAPSVSLSVCLSVSSAVCLLLLELLELRGRRSVLCLPVAPHQGGRGVPPAPSPSTLRACRVLVSGVWSRSRCAGRVAAEGMARTGLRTAQRPAGSPRWERQKADREEKQGVRQREKKIGRHSARGAREIGRANQHVVSVLSR